MSAGGPRSEAPVLLATGEVTGSELAQDRRRVGIRVAATLVAAFVIFAVVAFLGRRVLPGADDGGSRRTSLSFRADGFRGAAELLAALGHDVQRHRRSYGQLPPPRSTTLLILDPGLPPTLRDDSPDLARSLRRALQRWVEEGGHVILTLPGRDPRAVALFGMQVSFDPGMPEALELLSQEPVSRTLLEAASLSRSVTWIAPGEPVRGQDALVSFEDEWPVPEHDDVQRLRGFLREAEQVDDAGGSLLPVFREVPTEATALLEVGGRPLVLAAEVGAGRLYVVSSAYPFTNLALARLGTAPALAALVDVASEGGRRRLVIDEACHGLTLRRGLLGWVFETALFYPVAAVLLLVGILGWRGALRLGPVREQRTLPRRTKEEFVLSLADLTRRAGRCRAAGRWLLEAWSARLDPGPARLHPDLVPLEARLRQRDFNERALQDFAVELDRAGRRVQARTHGNPGDER